MADADAPIDVDMLTQELDKDADDARGGSISDVEHIANSVNGGKRDSDPDLTTIQLDPPPNSSHDSRAVSLSALSEVLQEKAVKRNGLAVIVPPVQNRWEYKVFQEEDEMDRILEEYDDAGIIEYLVLFSDGSEDVVSFPACVFFNTH